MEVTRVVNLSAQRLAFEQKVVN